MNKDVFLTGESISLRPITEQDVSGNYRGWLNDPEVTAYNSHGRFPMTPEKLINYVNYSSSSPNALLLAVVDNTNDVHIGNISLQDISWVDRSAEIAFLLGERGFWGKGVMFEAGKILINHGFKVLNLHRIYCGTSEQNLGMQKLAKKLGFSQEGIRKQAIFKNGKYLDVIEYGILSK